MIHYNDKFLSRLEKEIRSAYNDKYDIFDDYTHYGCLLELRTNCLPIEAIGKMLQSLCNLSIENLFDTDPQILTAASITGDLRWQAKQIGWIIKNV